MNIKFDKDGNLFLPVAAKCYCKNAPLESASKRIDEMFDTSSSSDERVERNLDLVAKSGMEAPDAVYCSEEEPVGVVPFRVERATSELDIMLDEYDAQFAHSILPDLHIKVTMEEQLRLCELHDIAQAANAAASKITGGWLL